MSIWCGVSGKMTSARRVWPSSQPPEAATGSPPCLGTKRPDCRSGVSSGWYDFVDARFQKLVRRRAGAGSGGGGRVLGGQLAPNSEKSWDVLANDGEKLQVKARVVSEPAEPGQLQLSPFRSFGFDSAVIVLLSATGYAVSRASKVPRYVVESFAIYRKHVNGKVLFARPEIMGHPDATDLTATLRMVQTGRKTP